MVSFSLNSFPPLLKNTVIENLPTASKVRCFVGSPVFCPGSIRPIDSSQFPDGIFSSQKQHIFHKVKSSTAAKAASFSNMNCLRRCHRVIFSRWRVLLRAHKETSTASCVPGVCVFFCKKIRQVNLGKFFGVTVERDFPRVFPSFPRVWSMIWRHETQRGLNDIPLYGSRCANGWTCIFSKFWNGSIDPTLVVQPTSNSVLKIRYEKVNLMIKTSRKVQLKFHQTFRFWKRLWDWIRKKFRPCWKQQRG